MSGEWTGDSASKETDDVLSDFLTSGNVKICRKWKNGDKTWSHSVLDVLSFGFQWSIQVAMDAWLIVEPTVWAADKNLGIIWLICGK